jgi:AhpD family alkylhydroperoxidase
MLDPGAALAHNVPVARSFALFELQAERWRRLDRGLTDLAVMAVAASIGCAWCLDFGYWETAVKHDVPAGKIRAVPAWRDSDTFTGLERLVLEYAEAMTGTPPGVTDEMVERAAQAAQRGRAGRAGRDHRGREPAVADERALGLGCQRIPGPVRTPGRRRGHRHPARAGPTTPRNGLRADWRW